MKRLFGGLMLALAMMLAATPALAQNADSASKRLALANRFIELMQTDQMSEMISGMSAAVAPSEMEDMSPSEQAEYRDVMTDVTAMMMPRLFEAMAPIYADIFTLEELEGLVAFYESDIGRSMMRKSYEAAPRITAVMQDLMPGLMVEMGDMMCDRYDCTPDERREMKATMSEAFPAPAR